MKAENWVTPGNAIWLVISLIASFMFLHNDFMLAGTVGILASISQVFVLIKDWYSVNDPLEAYAPGGAKYKPTPWNTERVADPSQPKPWWIGEAA